MLFEEFLNKIAEDPELSEKLQRSASPDEAYELAKEAGLSIEKDDFMLAMKKINEAYSEMSAEEIDAVVGGSHTSAIVSAVASAAGAAASTAIATAASGAAV